MKPLRILCLSKRTVGKLRNWRCWTDSGKVWRCSRHTNASFKSLSAFSQSPFEEGDPPHSEWTSCPNGKALAKTTALLKTGQFTLIKQNFQKVSYFWVFKFAKLPDLAHEKHFQVNWGCSNPTTVAVFLTRCCCFRSSEFILFGLQMRFPAFWAPFWLHHYSAQVQHLVHAQCSVGLFALQYKPPGSIPNCVLLHSTKAVSGAALPHSRWRSCRITLKSGRKFIMTYCINSEPSLKSTTMLFVFLKYTTGAVRLHSSHTLLVSAQISFPGLRHCCCHCSDVSKQQVQCKSSVLTLSTKLAWSSWLPCIWNSES